MNNKKILVVVAHPDDEILGCGGTMARLVAEDNDVFVTILGEGITSRYEDRTQVNKSLLMNLQSDSQKAADHIGVKGLFTFNLPDNRFDTVPLLDVVKIIEGIIDDIQPTTIYTHHNADLNIDHSIVYRATMTAVRPLINCPVKDVYSVEIPSSTEWSFQNYHNGFRPNVFVDITNYIDLKLESMHMYDSESREFPHPRSLDSLRAIARRWGSVVGVEYAEAMELIRLIY